MNPNPSILLLALFPLCTFHFSSSAAVPLRWTVETSRVQPAVFDAYQGETLTFEAALQSYGKPITNDLQGARIYWQTNGMGSAYWSAHASADGNILRATWTPSMDSGAKIYNCFLGRAGENYRAAFQLRMRASPGAVPNELELPRKHIDFAQVEVENAPWASAASVNAVSATAVNAHINATNALAKAIAAQEEVAAVRSVTNTVVLTNGTLKTKGGESITPTHIGAATDEEVQDVRVTATNANTVATNAYTLAREAIPSTDSSGNGTYATWDAGMLYVRDPYNRYYSYVGPGDIGLYGYDPHYGYEHYISIFDLQSQIYSLGSEVSNMYGYFPSYSDVSSMVSSEIYYSISASDYHFRSQVEEIAPIDASNPIFANQVMAVGTGFDPHVIEEINELTRRGSFSSNCWIVVDNYFQNNNIVKAVLKERTGKEQDRGTGWGYMLYDWTTDDRSWLLYVPELSATMTRTEPSEDKVISLPGVGGTPVDVRLEGFKGNPLISDVFELGELAAEVVYTEGKEGTNGCHSATYELSAVRRDGGNDAFRVIVTNVTHGVAPYAVSASFDATGQSFVVEYNGNVTVGPSAGGTYHAVATVSGIAVTTSEGTAVLSYSLSTDVTVTSEAVQDGSQTSEIVTSPHVTVSTTHDDTRLVATAMPAARMATVVSAHLYWDPVLKRTWKVDVANGCFYSRVVSEKNLTIKEQ